MIENVMSEEVKNNREQIRKHIQNLTDIREVLVLLLDFIDKLEDKCLKERKQSQNEEQKLIATK